MAYAIIILLLVIAFTYRGELFKRRVPGKSWLYTHRHLLSLLALTIVPVVLMNILVPVIRLDSPEKKILLGERLHDDFLIYEGFEELALEHRDSVELQFEFIDYYRRTHDDSNCNWLYGLYDRSYTRADILASVYTQFFCQEGNLNIALLNNLTEDEPYVNYLKAIYFRDNQRYSEAEKYSLREIELNESYIRNYSLLVDIYWYSDQFDKLDSLLNSSGAKYVDTEFRLTYYFVNQQWWNYLKTTYIHRFTSPDIFAYIASFFVSFIWLLFIRRMDIFNREKWKDIAIVFGLSILFTHLCLLWYDFSTIHLEFYITGDPFNDFFYCFSVIGIGEETVKLLPWLIFGIFSRKLKEPFDYLLYASVAALGFAFAENLMYLENSENIVVRSIMAAVAHMFDASVVAYGFILARFKYKQMIWKILAPLIAFILAALCHAFYDFWLISPWSGNLWMLTIVFFVISLHIWFYFKNNALNNSTFYRPEIEFDSGAQRDLISFGILSLLMLEFVIISYKFGAENGNLLLSREFLIVVVFLIYISLILEKINVRSGVWKRFKLKPAYKFNWSKLGGGLFSLPGSPIDEEPSPTQDYTGLVLRFFAPKGNPYLGKQLPQVGACIKQISINNDSNWYVVQMKKPLVYAEYHPNLFVIRAKHSGRVLTEDKIEIYFMFVPDERILSQESIDIKQLRYAGPVFSRPVNMS